MRLSLVLLATAGFALPADTNARSTDAITHPRLRQKVTSPDTVDAIDAGNLVNQAFFRVLKSVETVAAHADPEEERGLNGLSGWTKLKNLRKAERIKEIKEALAIAKVQVKAAADAAAAKAAQVKNIADQLDDATIQEILKNPKFKDKMFSTWHKDNVDPQLIFNALALLGKYTQAKWDGIAIAYLDFSTKMAIAAAKAK
ncbi:hypothetical protein L914_19703 [Phytophthora nicotianae]|uniref:RxLR effector protein n=1 Tax=Phytophthora nicotianae TaxID=4792 RepID=W2M9E1_PHYNI|nr:hypothetical protein L914_19703 [Phytophthora nicotianae]